MSNPPGLIPSQGGRGRGHRPPPRQVEVIAVERIAPRIISVYFSGDALRGFPEPAPTAHIKVFVPDVDGSFPLPVVTADGGTEWPNGRPIVRTYTPRSYNSETNVLEVQFVLHGDGPAAQWAERAQPGDRAAIGGPGGRFAIEPGDESTWWIAGDESAIPAVATLIEALPDSASGRVVLEVDGPDDHIALPPHAGVDVVWLDRTNEGDSRWGAELEAAAQNIELTDDLRIWIGTEANAVRRIRSSLLNDRAFDRDRLTTRGYWRLGAENHPDHDYGED